eukprot:jgi/Tetstr1/439837/TSEL_028248.t1
MTGMVPSRTGWSWASENEFNFISDSNSEFAKIAGELSRHLELLDEPLVAHSPQAPTPSKLTRAHQSLPRRAMSFKSMNGSPACTHKGCQTLTAASPGTVDRLSEYIERASAEAVKARAAIDRTVAKVKNGSWAREM